jgi:hypothetical protein
LERPFEQAVKKEGYDALFLDVSAGNFGHLTPHGNAVVAELLRQRLLATEPVRSLCRN